MREERRGREKCPHARATGSGSSAGLRRTRLRGTFVVRWGGRCLFVASPGGATDSARGARCIGERGVSESGVGESVGDDGGE